MLLLQHVNREIKAEEILLQETRRQIAEFKIAEGEDNKERATRLSRMEEEIARSECQCQWLM